MSNAPNLRRISKDLSALVQRFGQTEGKVARAAIEDRLNADLPGGRYSRSKMGAATVDVSGGGDHATVTGAGGPWTWLEEGTRAHTVRAAPGKVLRTPYGPRPEVNVSGITAQGTWGRGVDDAITDVRRDVAKQWNKAVG